MFLLEKFPDPTRLRPTAANEHYRRQFYSRWGQEHCIVYAASRRIEFPPYLQRLSVKAVISGAEHYEIDGRTTTLDEDNYLIVNDLRTYGSAIVADRPVQTFSVFFAPGFPEDVAGAIGSRPSEVLDHGGACLPRAIEFSEHLRPHDRLVTPVLRHIRRHVARGFRDDEWYEEQLIFLIERMLESQRRTSSVVARLPLARSSTRREAYRRIALATDYIHGNFRRQIRIDDLARAACLSTYHFIRLFAIVHGQTPYSYLQAKRANAARRLLETTELNQAEIAGRVGFESRTTMFRQLRRLTGVSGSKLRQASPAAIDSRRGPPEPGSQFLKHLSDLAGV
jgi:AraC family transcriptional regulator